MNYEENDIISDSSLYIHVRVYPCVYVLPTIFQPPHDLASHSSH